MKTSLLIGRPRLLRLSLLALLSSFLLASARADFLISQTFIVNADIPDSGELLDVRTLSTGGGVISNLTVGLDIASVSASSPAYLGDYYVSLGHDTGYAVLLNRPGKTSNDPSDPAAYGSAYTGLNVTLDDAAINGDIHAAAPSAPSNPGTLTGTLTGTWAPDARQTDPSTVLATDARTAPLSTFTGLPADGQWRLFIADDSAGGTGRLVSWTLNATLAPDGTTPLTVAAGGTLTATDTATLADKLVNQGHIVGPAGDGQALTFTGAVSGAGDFTGNFIFAGSYSPGNSPAAITFDGNLTFDSGHTLIMEIGGPAPGAQYDTISGSGVLTLGGTLNVVFINGYTPGAGDLYQFFQATTIEGHFDQVNLPDGYVATGDLADGGSFTLAAAIPEPAATAALLALAALFTAVRRRRFVT